MEDSPDGVGPIVGVPTSIALFAGWAPSGPRARAGRLTSFADFERAYGGLDVRSLLGYAVKHFYDNGGRDAYVLRIAAEDADVPCSAVIAPDDPRFQTALLNGFAHGGPIDRIDLFNIVCVPGLDHAPTLQALQEHCRLRRAFLVVDSPANATVQTAPDALVDLCGNGSQNSALYFPWVLAPDPLRGGVAGAFPPCGFVAGVYARTDSFSGVWKAPAGNDAGLTGAAGLAITMTGDEQGDLNPRGINCLRSLPGQGNVVFGARTLHPDGAPGAEWRYVPVRRTALFIEESLDRGTRWASFEPNDEALWEKLRLRVGAFIEDLFRRGAFQGATSRDAYFVKCDRQTTTQSDVDGGFVNIVVGFAPLKPAEFVVIRIRQMAGQTETLENAMSDWAGSPPGPDDSMP